MLVLVPAAGATIRALLPMTPPANVGVGGMALLPAAGDLTDPATDGTTDAGTTACEGASAGPAANDSVGVVDGIASPSSLSLTSTRSRRGSLPAPTETSACSTSARGREDGCPEVVNPLSSPSTSNRGLVLAVVE